MRGGPAAAEMHAARRRSNHGRQPTPRAGAARSRAERALRAYAVMHWLQRQRLARSCIARVTGHVSTADAIRIHADVIAAVVSGRTMSTCMARTGATGELANLATRTDPACRGCPVARGARVPGDAVLHWLPSTKIELIAAHVFAVHPGAIMATGAGVADSGLWIRADPTDHPDLGLDPDEDGECICARTVFQL